MGDFFEVLAESLFRHRGVVFFVLALASLLVADPSWFSLMLAMPLLALGCGLRAWAFQHLGGGGRTRQPRAPTSRVTSGPYQRLSHPVYLANVIISLALLTAASPRLWAALVLAAVVALSYLVLGWRETRQLCNVRERQNSQPYGLRRVARWERSTWLQIGLYLGALCTAV
ncbi:MAG: hypothetical protein CMP23_07950 [Rickettsiales bacterium]|nr:hypothetical protein [Rickettsiales bacterium]|tara:strand:- start:3756 stop:4268 length:513 start_codon:yes stop_codon:yes gene_type:complete